MNPLKAILIPVGVWLICCSSVAQNPTDRQPEKPSDQQQPSPMMFIFDGGTLNEFIDVLDKSFQVKIRERATITVPTLTAVPRMRVGLDPGPNEAMNAHNALVSIFRVYNGLAEHGFPELGRWYHSYGKASNSKDPLLHEFYFRSRSYESIAAELGRTAKAIESKLGRIRTHLKSLTP